MGNAIVSLSKGKHTMKANEQTYSLILGAMGNIPRENILNHAASLAMQPKYQSGGTGDLPMRIRWDWFWHACPTQIRDGIPQLRDMTDAHIDTVLRSVAKELGFPEFSS